MRMQYKDFIFPSNPRNIKVSSSVNCSEKPVYGQNSDVQGVSVNPSVITGNGEFYFEKGEDGCSYLMHLLRQATSGWLFVPSSPPMKAFLTEFSFEKNAQKGCCTYSFEFKEDCTDKSETVLFAQTIARKGENMFEIANRCNVDVSAIMRLNDFKTPFDIKEGDVVRLG